MNFLHDYRRALVAALFVILACGAWVATRFYPARSEQTQNAHTPPPSMDGYPRTILLADNTTAFIPAQPVKIVPANAGVTDILARIVDPKRIAAVPVQADTFSCAAEFWQKHKEIPRFGFYQAEPLLAIAPDLIIVSAFQDPNTTAHLRSAEIPILNLPQFETFDGMRKALRNIGEAIDEKTRAEALLNEFNARLEKVAQKLKGKGPLRVLGYSNFGNGYAVGVGGSQDEIIKAAGGTNAAAELNLVGPSPITFEQIVKLDPDALAVCGEAGMESPQAKILFSEPALANLRAVKTRRIAVVPSRYFDALSPYVVDAVEILAEQFYPELRGQR